MKKSGKTARELSRAILSAAAGTEKGEARETGQLTSVRVRSRTQLYQSHKNCFMIRENVLGETFWGAISQRVRAGSSREFQLM